jgi:hypothetical protein
VRWQLLRMMRGTYEYDSRVSGGVSTVMMLLTSLEGTGTSVKTGHTSH